MPGRHTPRPARSPRASHAAAVERVRRRDQRAAAARSAAARGGRCPRERAPRAAREIVTMLLESLAIARGLRRAARASARVLWPRRRGEVRMRRESLEERGARRASCAPWAARTPTRAARCTTATPFQLLVATILSAQCTDKKVNQVTPVLFARFGTAAALADARPRGDRGDRAADRLLPPEGEVDPGGRARLVERSAARCRATMDELITLRGVARKTANVVLGNAFGVPGPRRRHAHDPGQPAPRPHAPARIR